MHSFEVDFNIDWECFWNISIVESRVGVNVSNVTDLHFVLKYSWASFEALGLTDIAFSGFFTIANRGGLVIVGINFEFDLVVVQVCGSVYFDVQEVVWTFRRHNKCEFAAFMPFRLWGFEIFYVNKLENTLKN